MAEQEIEKREPRAGRRQLWIDWISTVLGMLASIVAAALTDAKGVPQFVQLILGGFVLFFTLAMAVVRHVAKEVRPGDRLKSEIQGAYLAALAKSPLNPMLEQVHHAE